MGNRKTERVQTRSRGTIENNINRIEETIKERAKRDNTNIIGSSPKEGI